jgi:hypothetical protein
VCFSNLFLEFSQGKHKPNADPENETIRFSPHFQVKTYTFSQNLVTITRKSQTLTKLVIGVVILKMVNLHCCIICLDNCRYDCLRISMQE